MQPEPITTVARYAREVAVHPTVARPIIGADLIVRDADEVITDGERWNVQLRVKAARNSQKSRINVKVDEPVNSFALLRIDPDD